MANERIALDRPLRELIADPEWQREVERFVDREVFYCVSELVSRLAQYEHYRDELEPVLYAVDYDSAAYEHAHDREIGEEDRAERLTHYREMKPVEYCDYYQVEPYDLDIYEHWLVSGYFALRLQERGHAVVEFCGLTIWGRPTTGQAIALDQVVNEIYLALRRGD